VEVGGEFGEASADGESLVGTLFLFCCLFLEYSMGWLDEMG